MAKELIRDGRIGGSADTIWRELRTQQELTSNCTGKLANGSPVCESVFLSQPGPDVKSVDDTAVAGCFEQLALF